MTGGSIDSAGAPHPGRPSPGIARLLRTVGDPFVRVCHRPTLDGLEHLPTSGAFLLVGNHSAGLAIAELLTLLVMYLRYLDPDRPIAGFAHSLAFRIFPVSALLHSVGAVPSTYEVAERVLSSGMPLLVFPGGDYETLRPIWQAHRVDFGGRLGFLRIARSSGVPIVPLGIRGSHFTAPVLFRSRVLANLLVVPRLLGLKRWGVSLLGAIGALAIALFVPGSWALRVALVWVWLGSPLTFAPWIPWTLRMRIGAPIPTSVLFPSGERAPTDEELRLAAARVQAAVQALVDR